MSSAAAAGHLGGAPMRLARDEALAICAAISDEGGGIELDCLHAQLTARSAALLTQRSTHERGQGAAPPAGTHGASSDGCASPAEAASAGSSQHEPVNVHVVLPPPEIGATRAAAAPDAAMPMQAPASSAPSPSATLIRSPPVRRPGRPAAGEQQAPACAAAAHEPPSTPASSLTPSHAPVTASPRRREEELKQML